MGLLGFNFLTGLMQVDFLRAKAQRPAPACKFNDLHAQRRGVEIAGRIN